MPQPTPFPTHLTGSAFTFQDARDAGVSRRRLTGGLLAHPFRGLYTDGLDLNDVVDRCHALLPAMTEHQYFSHRTAAMLWGIPLPFDRPDPEGRYPTFGIDPLDVLTVGPYARPERVGVTSWGTRAARIDTTTYRGLPVVAPYEAWCQLAALPRRWTIDPYRLIAAADYLLSGPYEDRQWHPLCTVDQLDDAIRRRRRQRGVRVMELVRRRVRYPVGSPMETLVRLELVDHGLPEPEVQFAVETSAGLRHSDLGYRRGRLLLEYQGDEHRVSKRRWREDLTRVQLFEDAGYKTILFGFDDVVPTCHALADRIRRSLAARS